MTQNYIASRIMASKKLRHDNRQKFLDTFGISIDQFYDKDMGDLLGFDIVKFDEEFVKPEHDESAYDAIVRKWGEEAATMIESLL